MRSSMPFRKLESTPKQFEQSTEKKPFKSKHERITSMLELLQVNGKEVFDDEDKKKLSLISERPNIEVEEYVEKEFEGLRERIKTYCQNQSVKFMQISEMEKIAMEEKRLNGNRMIEENVMKLFYERIREFLKENDFEKIEKIEKISIKKLDFMSDNEKSCSDSYSKENNGTVAKIEHREKMESIEVNKCQVYNSKMRINMKSTGDKFHPTNFINNLPMSCSSTVSEILYKEAQNKPFHEFHDFCSKILLQSKPIISDINLFKDNQLEKTNFYLNEIYKKLNLLNTKLSNLPSTGELSPMKKELNFYENKKKNIGEEIDYICSILKKINQVHNIDSLFLTCQRPCCKFQNSPNSIQTKAKILMNLKQAAKKSIHYKTEVTDNYFNRYYHNDKFDMSRVYSLAKTKNEEMETLEKTYYRNRDKSKPCKKRSHSLYENF